MMKQAKEAGCEKVYNGMSMMLFQALIAIKLYTGKDTPVDYMKEKTWNLSNLDSEHIFEDSPLSCETP